MDNPTLEVMLIIIGLLSLSGVLYYLYRRKLLKEEIVHIVIAGLGLSIEVIELLPNKYINLKRLKIILLISKDALEYADKLIDAADKDKAKLTYDYSLKIAEEQGIKLTEADKANIKHIIDYFFTNK